MTTHALVAIALVTAVPALFIQAMHLADRGHRSQSPVKVGGLAPPHTPITPITEDPSAAPDQAGHPREATAVIQMPSSSADVGATATR